MTDVPPTSLTTLSFKQARVLTEQIAVSMGSVIRGKTPQIKMAINCLVSRGHLLLEDVPGVGKTTFAEAMAQSCGLSFSRVQFTSDVMPSDIVGAQIFNQQTSLFSFRQGPIFRQMVLADELNRAPAKTQSALLEAMAQSQVSIDGTTHPLPHPFMVIATQNPEEWVGTFPLPDSQLDRFQVRLSLGYPDQATEAKLLTGAGYRQPLAGLQPIISADDLIDLQRCASQVLISESLASYAVAVAQGTRSHPELERGVSTRALLGWMGVARTHALWDDRHFVTPLDLQETAVPCLAHRLVAKTPQRGTSLRQMISGILDEVLNQVPVPR